MSKYVSMKSGHSIKTSFSLVGSGAPLEQGMSVRDQQSRRKKKLGKITRRNHIAMVNLRDTTTGCGRIVNERIY